MHFFLIVVNIPYCYYYKRVLILANIGDLVITAKFCARYWKVLSSITMNITRKMVPIMGRASSLLEIILYV